MPQVDEQGPGEATGEVPHVDEQGRSCGPIISAADADSLAESTHLLATLQSAAESLKACGAIKAVITLQNEMHKAQRHLRVMSTEDPAVLLALARQRDIENAKELERRRLIHEANARTLTAEHLKHDFFLKKKTRNS